jgi:hypothetical protein
LPITAASWSRSHGERSNPYTPRAIAVEQGPDVTEQIVRLIRRIAVHDLFNNPDDVMMSVIGSVPHRAMKSRRSSRSTIAALRVLLTCRFMNCSAAEAKEFPCLRSIACRCRSSSN